MECEIKSPPSPKRKVIYGDIEQIHPCMDCGDYYDDEPDFDIKVPDIEWIIQERRKGYDNERKVFLKGFITAFLIMILFHLGLAYVLFI